jgi:hypothetical protein
MTSDRLTRRTVLAGAAAGLAGAGLVGTAVAGRNQRRRDGDGTSDDPTDETTDDSADETTDDSTDETTDDATDGTTLTDDEREGLLFMREEEKLARDVYLALYDEWGLTVFDNVAESEQRHVDAMLSLLEKYDLPDPSPDASGEFADDTLQELFDTLVARGRTSAVEALRVGGLIEETDILDIAEEIEQTDEADIRRVYENLLEGSENHLGGFVSALERYGVDYEAQVLDQEDVDAIVDDA